jgi:hypothetical protein
MSRKLAEELVRMAERLNEIMEPSAGPVAN